MLTVKQAAQRAESFVRDLYQEKELDSLRLEEIDRADDGTWRITLGWVEPRVARPGGLAPMFSSHIEALPRVYKVVEVDNESGEVKAMKIRDVG